MILRRHRTADPYQVFAAIVTKTVTRDMIAAANWKDLQAFANEQMQQNPDWGLLPPHRHAARILDAWHAARGS